MDNPSRPASAPAAPDLTGRTLDDFRVMRRLGSGGMGEVYLAEQVSLGRKVALKILRADLIAASPSAMERFQAEARAVARATHANIVQVYATGTADGVPYMALEYVEGRNLKEYLTRKGPPEVLLALSIMRQVAAALARASELGIVHRDIKPENILLTRKGEVKVADFGLSRCLTVEQPLNLTQSGVTMGTPLYMSPEQVEGKPLDPRTDIYSFGVTCYHMLAGQPPFRGETAIELALKHVQQEPEPLAKVRPDLPEPLCAIVHKMMAKSPESRYQTARDLLKDVVRVRESVSGQTAAVQPISLALEASTGEAGHIVPPPLPGAPLRADTMMRPGRSWRPTLLLASLLVALTLGASFGWLRRHAAAPAHAATVPFPEEPTGSLRKEEQARRDVLANYLKEPEKADRIVVLGESLDLAFLYLRQDRLEEAKALFSQLDRIRGPSLHGYHTVGHLGLGVVLALSNHPRESNGRFREVCPEPSRDGKQTPFEKNTIWQKQEWRYWVMRAVAQNHANGVEASEVPQVLNKVLRHK